jgi:hypothetical protein
LAQKDIFQLKFEDLVSERREQIIRQMVAFYKERVNCDLDTEQIVRQAIRNINPKQSHTFRKGKVGSWKYAFSSTHKAVFKSVAGDLLIKLGYEQNMDW